MPSIRDFDAERREQRQDPKTFTIAGREFRVRPGIAPEAFDAYEAMTGDENAGETARIVDKVILMCIYPDDAEAWYAARQESDPLLTITLQDLLEVLPWLMQEALGRPLEEPESSTVTPEATGTDSQASTDGPTATTSEPSTSGVSAESSTPTSSPEATEHRSSASTASSDEPTPASEPPTSPDAERTALWTPPLRAVPEQPTEPQEQHSS